MPEQIPIKCIIMRGGTSKGVFFREQDLPGNPNERERLILSLMGSPDPRQIDGLARRFTDLHPGGPEQA